jgi:hypothetical protein
MNTIQDNFNQNYKSKNTYSQSRIDNWLLSTNEQKYVYHVPLL